jgi:hypothetical protein
MLSLSPLNFYRALITSLFSLSFIHLQARKKKLMYA